MPIAVTIADRFRAAWTAFKQDTKPDPNALDNYLAQRRAEREASLNKLEPYDKALVASIAGDTANADRLLEQVMPAVEQLELEDQARVMMHMCQHNPRIITTTPVRMWVTRRDNLRSLAHLIARKEEIVVVR